MDDAKFPNVGRKMAFELEAGVLTGGEIRKID